MAFKATDAWMGITDKYWAAALLPEAAGEETAAAVSPYVATLEI